MLYNGHDVTELRLEPLKVTAEGLLSQTSAFKQIHQLYRTALSQHVMLYDGGWLEK